MGSVNHGNQNINYSFFDDLRQEDWARKDNHITPRGIYKGGYLTRIDDTEIVLSPFKAEIGDDNIQVSIDTSAVDSITTATLDTGTLDEAHPYIVLRYAYSYTPYNYCEIHAVAAPLSNDLVVGKVLWTGVTTITGFDYTERSEPQASSYVLKAEATGRMDVRVHGGQVHTQTGGKWLSNQVVIFAAPTSNSRIDLIYVDSNGILQVREGVISPTPVAPGYDGMLVLAEVRLQVGQTEITSTQIKDVRVHCARPLAVDATTVKYDVDGKLAVNLPGVASASITPYYTVIDNYTAVYFTSPTQFPNTESHREVSYGGVNHYLFTSTLNVPYSTLRTMAVNNVSGISQTVKLYSSWGWIHVYLDGVSVVSPPNAAGDAIAIPPGIHLIQVVLERQHHLTLRAQFVDTNNLRFVAPEDYEAALPSGAPFGHYH